MTYKERKKIALGWIRDMINEGDIFAHYERPEKDTSFEIHLNILQESIRVDFEGNDEFGDLIIIEDNYDNGVLVGVEVDDPANYLDFKRRFYDGFIYVMQKTVESVIYNFKR